MDEEEVDDFDVIDDLNPDQLDPPFGMDDEDE
jgi:hypothetical protein